MINNNKVYLFNICPFSITEIVSAATPRTLRILSHIKKGIVCFFTCVRNYIEHGATASFYKLRATLLYSLYSLYSLYPSAIHNITCEDNVGDLFCKLMKTYEVNIETIKCQNSQCCS